MKIIRYGIMLCDDCLIVAVNGDYTGFDNLPEDQSSKRIAEVNAGLERLGRHLVPAYDAETGKGIEEHSIDECDCCLTHFHGSRHEFAILGNPREPLPFESKACSRYGADMGRRSDKISDLSGRKVRLQRVPACDGGDYDPGGAYWGGIHSSPLFCAWDDEFTVYFRASSREEAKRQIQGARFYR